MTKHMPKGEKNLGFWHPKAKHWADHLKTQFCLPRATEDTRREWWRGIHSLLHNAPHCRKKSRLWHEPLAAAALQNSALPISFWACSKVECISQHSTVFCILDQWRNICQSLSLSPFLTVVRIPPPPLWAFCSAGKGGGESLTSSSVLPS